MPAHASRSRGRARAAAPALLAAALLVLTLGAPPAAPATDLLRYALRSLDGSGARVALAHLRGRPTLMLLFEPRCSWCLKQTREINRLLERCRGLQAVGVGVNGDRRALIEMRARMRAAFPLYEINPAMYRDLGGEVPGTPLLLITDRRGLFVQHLRGYQPEERLLPRLAADGACDAAPGG